MPRRYNSTVSSVAFVAARQCDPKNMGENITIFFKKGNLLIHLATVLKVLQCFFSCSKFFVFFSKKKKEKEKEPFD